jgi:hypothetical protein
MMNHKKSFYTLNTELSLNGSPPYRFLRRSYGGRGGCDLMGAKPASIIDQIDQMSTIPANGILALVILYYVHAAIQFSNIELPRYLLCVQCLLSLFETIMYGIHVYRDVHVENCTSQFLHCIRSRCSIRMSGDKHGSSIETI